MNKIYSSILSKVFWMGLVAGLSYITADSLHLLPQSIKDLVSWTANNFILIVFAVCFLAAMVVIRNYQNRQRGAS